MKIVPTNAPQKIENKHFLAQSLIVAIAISAACGCSDDKKNTPAPSPECTIDDQCAGNLDGRTKCSSDGVCVEPQIIQKDCNNNVADGNEQCDGEDLRGKSCADVGAYAGGTLKCTSTCSFDVSGCYECQSESDCEDRTDGKTQCDTNNKVCVQPSQITCNNDNVADDGELCDGTDLRGKSCADAGAYAGGELKCSSTCTYDVSGCYECQSESDCEGRTDGKTQCDTDNKVCVLPGLQIICNHNNVADEDESCDGTDLRGNKCSDMGSYAGGTLKCNSACDYDFSECYECISSADCAGRLDGKTECDNVSHVCLEPGTTQAHFEWLTDYTCGMDTFEGNVQYSAMTGENHTIYGLIWVKGCTENQQWCNKIVGARVHYKKIDDAMSGTINPFYWSSFEAGRNALFNFSSPNQNNNEYMSTLRFSDGGQYLYVYSFDLKNNPDLGTEIPQTVYCYVNWSADATVGTSGHAFITAPAACNNDILEQGESCDTNQLNGKTCASWSEFVDGTLACNKSCDFDKSACVECTADNLTKCGANQECRDGHCRDKAHEITCGDGLVEGSEQCDKTNYNGKSCADFAGFVGGDLACDSSCKFVTDGCFECNGHEDCADRTDGKTRCDAHVCSEPLPEAAIVISQLYTGGGYSGSTYKTKYIELFNRSNDPQTLSGWSIQYGTADGATLSRCNLPNSVTMPAGSYYLVELASGSYGDQLSTATDYRCVEIDPAAQSGKFFLVPSSTTLTSATPASGYIDGVGYGNANWFEGSSATGLLSTTNAALRNNAGCDDTDDNADDFTLGKPAPRNSSTAIHLCSLSPENTDAACHDTKDNDGDNKTDCEDPECYDFCYSPENTDATCHDGQDNDGDNKIDCEDPECRSFCLEPENTDAKCKDGIDNDGNELVDCEDSSCTSFCNTRCTGTNQTYLPAYDLCAHNISNKDDLITLSKTWNQYGGNEYVIEAGKPVAFVLTKNIGLGAQSDWEGIGNDEHPFNALFVGNERVVSGNLTCSNKTCGLFGVLDDARIHNLRLENLSINANDAHYAGILAGQSNKADIQSILVSKDSLTTINVKVAGGLVGYVLTDDNSLFTVSDINISNVTLNVTGGSYAAGVIGQLIGNFDIHDVISSGDLSVNSNLAGGFVGYSKCINNCKVEDVTLTLYLSSKIAESNGVVGGFWGEMADDSGELLIKRVIMNNSIKVNSQSALGLIVSGVVGNQCIKTNFVECDFQNQIDGTIATKGNNGSTSPSVSYHISDFSFFLKNSRIADSSIKTGINNFNAYTYFVASIEYTDYGTPMYASYGYAASSPKTQTLYFYHISDVIENTSISNTRFELSRNVVKNLNYSSVSSLISCADYGIYGSYCRCSCESKNNYCRGDSGCGTKLYADSYTHEQFAALIDESVFNNVEIIEKESNTYFTTFSDSNLVNILIRNNTNLNYLSNNSRNSLFDTLLSNVSVDTWLSMINSISTVMGSDIMQYASETEAVTKLNAKLADEVENGGNLDSGQYAPWFINGETGKAELNLSADRSQWYTVE